MNQVTFQSVKRSDLKPGEVLCDYCTAKCCQYFALALDTPETYAEFDFIRWYVLHQETSLFTEDGTWYLVVHQSCSALLPDNRCGIYEIRPQICRDYTTDNCEYEPDGTYDQLFETWEQLNEYMDARFFSADRFRTPKPTGLPMVTLSRSDSL